MQTVPFCEILIGVAAIVLALFGAAPAAHAQEGELLYNGIRLPAQWPPADGPLSYEPMDTPWLESPPDVIPIDVGRQLFVDDFLVADTSLERVHHAATYWPDNPVLAPDRPWENKSSSADHPAPTAMVFSDGVFYDPQDELFKMWYMAGYCDATAYATSTDGIRWTKRALDVAEGTNLVETTRRDSGTVWLDLAESDPAKRFKMVLYTLESDRRLALSYSADGIHWTPAPTSGKPLGDRSTMFLNPFRNVWVYSLRAYERGGIGRYRRYWEHRDIEQGLTYAPDQPPFWVGADRLDPPRADLGTPCELYNLDAAAYESLIIGLFDIWRGQPDDRSKPNELCIGFSRDGFHWHRPMREAFIPVSETYGDWNWGNVQSAGGCCLVVGDRLYFYVSGRSGVQGSKASSVCATGLATLRRDGFTSMDAGDAAGTLLTRPVQFSGKYLFVNLDAPDGELRVEVCDLDGNAIAPFTRAKCRPVQADSCREPVRWKSGADLSALAGTPVRFRFHLRRGRLYAFWVSADASGASRGYVAAGGPGFTGPADTAGQ
ncbi:MAG: hypothetical protein JXR94_07195 [Candidatus Hydrogenedentes bacterium]|nr:hypothetical protein [Candidatus Hydrogenedentota bacterium]